MIDAEPIGSSRMYVLEDSGRMIGFYGLIGEPLEGRLEWMFLEPEAIGHGSGRLLWNDATQRARAAGFTELVM